MARRKQLEDVADAISGYIARDTPWMPDWPLGDIGRAVNAVKGPEFDFDLIHATATPSTRALNVRATRLRNEFVRHLDSRRIPEEWVSGATANIHVVDGAASGSIAVRCEVMIIDDGGNVRTSTRKCSSTLPRKQLWQRPMGWLSGSNRPDGEKAPLGRAWQHPFDSLETKGGRANAGSLEGRAVLLVPFSWSSWELHDRPWHSPDEECEDSYWTGDARSVGRLASWEIEWVPSIEVKPFVKEHFPDLDNAMVWKHHDS